MTTGVPFRFRTGGAFGGIGLALILAMLIGFGCASDNEDATGPDLPTAETDDCVGCHTSKEKLTATADPLPPPPGEGSGEG
jgi:hypothetical protein